MVLMGSRAHIVNLETGKKVYSHWGAMVFRRANSFEELKEQVEEMYREEIEHRNPEKVGIKEFTDEDAVEDLDLHIERVFVIDEDEFRGYTRTILHDREDGTSDDMVVFKFYDSGTFWDARHISLRLKHYNEAYKKLNIDDHKNEALEQSLRNSMGNVERDVKVIYSSISPRRYDLAIKEVVQEWSNKGGEQKDGPLIVRVNK